MPSAAAIADYRHKLKNHDWSFEFSDDQTMWQRGRDERKELDRLQGQLDLDAKIWNQFAPSDFQRKGK